MSSHRPLELVVDRLCANLRAAGIGLSETDLEGILASKMLLNVTEFEAATADLPLDVVPERVVPPPPVHDVALDDGFAERTRDASELSIVAVAARLRARETSPVELVERSLERIATRDGQLNAFQLVLADRARERARQAEREIRSGSWRGPLHGIPVAVKDLFAMNGTVTAAGSRLRAERATDFDATTVERLERAGAVIVGKTRMPEFAYSPGSNNPHYGATANPHDPTRDAGGSSSGSGAAVADGMAFAALGSDTGGSIRLPAANCGVVGLKPTFGRVSLYGAVPLAWSLDHAGPLTRSVADAAVMLEVLAGRDPRDPRTQWTPETWRASGAGNAQLRVGVLVDPPLEKWAGAEVVAVWRQALATLERSGCTLREVTLRELDPLRVVNYAILAAEAGAYHERDLRERPDVFGAFCRQRLLAGFAYGPQSFARARQARAMLAAQAARLFEVADLLVLPATPEAAPPLGVPSSVRFTSPFNALGWPAVVVPAGESAAGLPLGLQIVARSWDEASALEVARKLEAERVMAQTPGTTAPPSPAAAGRSH
jgi:aspartyl-tRNA(Asn)/glutamyl-tRNA(Gln) amidotransferase subunit A